MEAELWALPQDVLIERAYRLKCTVQNITLLLGELRLQHELECEIGRALQEEISKLETERLKQKRDDGLVGEGLKAIGLGSMVDAFRTGILGETPEEIAAAAAVVRHKRMARSRLSRLRSPSPILGLADFPTATTLGDNAAFISKEGTEGVELSTKTTKEKPSSQKKAKKVKKKRNGSTQPTDKPKPKKKIKQQDKHLNGNFVINNESVVPQQSEKAEESNGPKINEPKTDEPKIDEPKIDEPKIDEPKIDEPKADEPKIDEPKIDEPKIGEPKTDEPTKVIIPVSKMTGLNKPIPSVEEEDSDTELLNCMEVEQPEDDEALESLLLQLSTGNRRPLSTPPSPARTTRVVHCGDKGLLALAVEHEPPANNRCTSCDSRPPAAPNWEKVFAEAAAQESLATTAASTPNTATTPLPVSPLMSPRFSKEETRVDSLEISLADVVTKEERPIRSSSGQRFQSPCLVASNEKSIKDSIQAKNTLPAAPIVTEFPPEFRRKALPDGTSISVGGSPSYSRVLPQSTEPFSPRMHHNHSFPSGTDFGLWPPPWAYPHYYWPWPPALPTYEQGWQARRQVIHSARSAADKLGVSVNDVGCVAALISPRARFPAPGVGGVSGAGLGAGTERRSSMEYVARPETSRAPDIPPPLSSRESREIKRPCNLKPRNLPPISEIKQTDLTTRMEAAHKFQEKLLARLKESTVLPAGHNIPRIGAHRLREKVPAVERRDGRNVKVRNAAADLSRPVYVLRVLIADNRWGELRFNADSILKERARRFTEKHNLKTVFIKALEVAARDFYESRPQTPVWHNRLQREVFSSEIDIVDLPL